MATFRARARAVDMLGRQQIASLPTALSELFKNSHDAYATRARADFYRVPNLLAVTDDGSGMNSDTFVDAWLTIATESKFGRTKTPVPKGMRRRAQLGEKGIGRLAIGVLGGQVLVISKTRNDPAILAFVNWRMFELPHLNLDEVPIGLAEIGDTRPTAKEIVSVKEPVRERIVELMQQTRSRDERADLKSILEDLDGIPDDLLSEMPDLMEIGVTGTQFLIAPVSDDLIPELESRTDRESSSLAKTLQGFTDAWLGPPTSPDFEIDFVDHRPGGDSESLLDPDDFFLEDDPQRADHHILGQFLSDGSFEGTLDIFGQGAVDLEIASPLPSAPRCGSFEFELSYIQGVASESRLDPEAFELMRSKLIRHGGLYVYMDGIRVQPYGRPDEDWLEIEERRTRGAAYYYFSYRRMFGAVQLSTDKNSALKEKAGREGFTQGGAYWDLKKLLINLLEELAAGFFRAGAQSDTYERERRRLKQYNQQRAQRDREADTGRRRLRRELSDAIVALSERDYKTDTSTAVEQLEAELAATKSHTQAREAVSSARKQLEDMAESLKFTEPVGFAPTTAMRQDMAFVESGIADLQKSHILPALSLVDEIASETERRLETSAEDHSSEQEKFIGRVLEEARGTIHTQIDATQTLVEDLQNAFRAQLEEVSAAFADTIDGLVRPASASDRWLSEQAEFESSVAGIIQSAKNDLGRIAQQIRTVLRIAEGDAPDAATLAAAVDEEIVELREQSDLQLEWAQLGMALGIVEHDFRVTVGNIRRDIRRVRSWAKKNPQMVRLYEDLNRDFEHLDNYLQMLTPMQRRARRQVTQIKGAAIIRFLRELFFDRLRALSVELEVTEAFQTVGVTGFPSTFYPVFVSLVDNSLYWFEHGTSIAEPSIHFGAESDHKLIYKDNGIGIDDHLVEAVFDLGFTTKPGGTGLGLSIARQVLDRAGWDLLLMSCDSGVEFHILKRADT